MASVYIARCADYREPRVAAAIREAVDALGGIGAFVKPGQRALIKPNLLRPASPKQGVTTHPHVVKAVAQLVQEAGATALIADSPAGPHSRVYLGTLYAMTGMTAVAKAAGAICNTDMHTTQFAYPEGHFLREFEMLAVATEADVIINLPKLKTHGFATFTGAIKNLYGLIPGTTKSAYHARLDNAERFCRMLVDIYYCRRPALTVMDAVVGMEGNGPSNGDSREVGFILASADGIALDVVATALVGIEPLSVPTLAAAAEWGLTTGRVEDIQILGLPFAEARLERPFRLPVTRTPGRRGLLAPLRWFLPANYLAAYPVANARCTACGACVRSCPVGAIRIVGERARMDLRTCIRCYCCHEICAYDAVDLRRRALARLLAH